MPKPTKGRRLGGSSSHQKALLANLATSLFEHGRIKTTEPKARALRPYAEKLITHAKKGTLHNRREVIKKIRDKEVVHTLFAEIGPFFADRNGGYTRIIKVEARKGDNAPMAVIELVREKTVTSEANRARRAGAKKAAPAKALPRRGSGRRGSCGGVGRGDQGRGRGDRRRADRRGWPRRRRQKPRSKRPRLPTRPAPRRTLTSPSDMNERARHRFRWRACSFVLLSSGSTPPRHRLRRNGVRGLGGAGRPADGRRRSRRGVVDGVPHPGAAARGRAHRHRRPRHRPGGPRRRACRRDRPRLSAARRAAE